MAAATRSIESLVGTNRRQTSRAFEWVTRVDCSAIDAGSGSGAGESNDFLALPAGAVITDLDVILLTAEGGVATIDIGTEADPDGLLDGGDINGTPDALVAKAGTEALAGGYYVATAEDLRLTTVAAADAAVFDVVVRGYMLDV